MDGKNSSGRRVSLLNDHCDAPPQLIRLPSISPSLRSRTSSYSSPLGSPPTPRLVRSDSSDSITMQTPSPITPDFAFETMSHGLGSPDFPQHTFFPQQKDYSYPQMPQSGPLPYHPAAQQASYMKPQYAQEVQPPANMRPKKNSYPCPMAKQYQCSDYFTTSGHAARHAKKHTGKKDAFCPECNKAFTRKDNMEQHRRTHQGGRTNAKGVEASAKKPRTQQLKRPRPSTLQSSEPSMSLPMVDPSLPPISPQSYMAQAVMPADPYAEMMARSSYPDPTPYSMTHSYSSSGLDALAIAASGEKRKFES